MSEKINLEMPVVVYGKLEKYNEVISKARCRIFYKYENRNGTYITDEFANLLLSSIPYAPVKGIYDNFEEDYTDHGSKRSLGRIYGVVPENPNVAWERHLDEDGVEREYACADVLIFTGLYKEASEILNKAQSMELYDKSIEGEWQIINGKKYYVFKKGSFLGLQVLGEDTEPCFQGAAFYSLLSPLKDLLQEYQIFQKQGGQKMPNIKFKLSDDQKMRALWSLLNPNFTEEGGYTIDFNICEVYDQYAIVANLNEGIFERVYYTKDDSSDSVKLEKRERCYIVDVNESEKQALDVLQTLNGGTYEKIDENYENNNQKIEELDKSIATLKIEKAEAEEQLEQVSSDYETLKTDNETLQTNYETLKSENEALSSYKNSVELEQKRAVLDKYSKKLSTDIIDTYNENIDSYTVTELAKELAYQLCETNSDLFTLESDQQRGYVPKDAGLTGIESILDRYKNK